MNGEIQEIQLYEGAPAPLTASAVRQQINRIQEIMKDAMKEGEHFGKIPGCGDKPSLKKPGAEKLILTFRMAPKYEVIRRAMPGNHVEYEVCCSLFSIGSETFLGQGVGSCSSMEAKYRYRTGPGESTGQPVPKQYWDNRDQGLLGGKGFQAKKVEGKWEIVRQGEKVEHENPADYYNTILKMAKKRALVDAVLTVTAASDIFTQDLEDLPGFTPDSEESTPSPTTGSPSKEPSRGSHKASKEKSDSNLDDQKKETVNWLNENKISMKAAQDYLKKSYGDWDEKDLNVLKDWGKAGFKDEEDIPY